MSVTTLNIRTENEIKDRARSILKEKGLSMTAAVNLFLRAVVKERQFPFELAPYREDIPNKVTAAAIVEGRRIASDPKVKSYTSMAELKAALEK